MDVQTLLNTLTAGGFTLSPHGTDSVAIHGPTNTLTPAIEEAIREHKSTLRHLACIPCSEAEAEREAIQWADTPAADEALEAALADWDSLPLPPPPCPHCGGIIVWWDMWDQTHCSDCDPPSPKGERIRRQAAAIRKRTRNVVESKSPEVKQHPERL